MHRLGISNWSFDAFEGDDNDDGVNAAADDNGDEYDDDLEFLIKALCTCATSKDETSERRFKNALGLNCNRATIETGPDQKGQRQCVCKVSGIAIWSDEWSNEPIHKIGEIIVWPKKQRPCAPWGNYEKIRLKVANFDIFLPHGFWS